MSISDRYSCQEHGQDKHEDCIACEVYGDIAELVERIAELEQQLAETDQVIVDRLLRMKELDKENASLKERIVELEQQLLRSKANYFDLRRMFERTSHTMGELEAERDAAYNAGMERAAEIAEGNPTAPGVWIAMDILEEIEK